MKKLTALLLLLPVLASADPHSWMKKDDPETLSINVIVGSADCPMTKKEIEVEAKNVFIRSRIKPLSGGIYDWEMPPYLSIELQCTKLSENSSVVFANLTIDLVGMIDLNDPYDKNEVPWPKYEPNAVLFRHGVEPYLGLQGTVGKSLLRSTIRDAVEDFMADYISANFDLGEDED